MRYWTPTAAFVPQPDARRSFAEGLGGHPFGIDPAAWPACASCGLAMSHIGQFRHHPERLDLGAPDRILTMWMCEHDPGMCDTWLAFGGANAVTVSAIDGRFDTCVHPPSPDVRVYPRVDVVGWIQGDDGVAPEHLAHYFDESTWLDLTPPTADRYTTRLGPVPHWLQRADESPPPPWAYVGQVDESVRVDGEPPDPDATGIALQFADGRLLRPAAHGPDDRSFVAGVDDGGWYVPGPNFGMGISYLFLDRTNDPPTACFMWQR